MNNYFGLLIGVGNYNNISKLYKTTKDARDLYNTLIITGYPEANMVLLLDREATKQNISDQLDWLAEYAKSEEDTVIIYFSGHGLRKIGGLWRGEYLCPVETDLDHQHPPLTLISSKEFSEALQSIHAGRVVVLLDACHAGGIGEVKDAKLNIKPGLTEGVISNLTSGKGRVIIASSKTDEPSYELAGMEHGLFTHYLLDGLDGNAALPDGRIPITRIFEHIYYHVVDHKPQHPFMKFDGEDFTIAQQPSSAVSIQDQSQQKDAILINLRDDNFTPEQAETILTFLYLTYHGRNPDETGRNDWLPILEKFGGLGLGSTFEMIINSGEMKERAKKELEKYWQGKFFRPPDDDEVEKLEKFVRLYRQRGFTDIEAKLDYTEQLRKQASQLSADGKSEEAEVLINQAMQDGFPASWEIWHEKGLALYHQGKYEEAIPAYQKAIWYSLWDEWPYSCDDLKNCYGNLPNDGGKFLGQGLDFFIEVTNKFPNRWAAWHQCGWLSWKAGKPLEAIPYYQKAISLIPVNTWAWSALDLLQVYRDTNQKEQAYDYYTDLLREKSGYWEIWQAVAWIEWQFRNNIEDAIHYFHKAIQLLQDNKWPWSHDDLKCCYSALAEKDPAFYYTGINYFLVDTKAHPERWAAWHQCGWLSWKAGKLSEAIAYYQMTINLIPKNTWAWSILDLSHVYFEANLKEDGYEYLTKLTEVRADFWEVWHAKAWMEWQAFNQISDAIQTYKKAIQVHINQQPGNKGWEWSWIDMGDCLKQLGDLKGAKDAYENAALVAPQYNVPIERLNEIREDL